MTEQRDSQTTADGLARLGELCAALADTHTLAAAAELLLDETGALLSARAGLVALGDAETAAPVIMARRGYTRDTTPAPEELTAALRAEQPSWSGGAVSLPLRARAMPLGALLLSPPPGRTVSADERSLLRALAASGAQALARLQADERYRELVANAPVGLIVSDAAGAIQQVNAVAAWMLGLSPAELLGTSLADRLPQIEAAPIALPHPPIRWSELAARQPDGSSTMLAVHRRPIGPPGDSRILTALVDLSERVRAEQAAGELERKLSTLIDLLPVGVSILNAERQVVYSNAALAQIMSLSHQSLAAGAYNAFRFIHPGGEPFPAGDFPTARVLAGEAAVHDVEVGIDRGDGDSTWVSVSAVAVSFSDWRIVALTHDITSRKRAELAAQGQLSRMELLTVAAIDFAEANLDLAATLDLTVRRAAETVGDTSVVMLRGEDASWLSPVAFYHRDPDAAELLRASLREGHVQLGEGVAGTVARDGQPALILARSEAAMRAIVHPSYHSYMERYGIEAKLVVPLHARGAIIGTLSLTRDRGGRPYDEADQIFLQALADRAALALDNARLWQQAQEELAARTQAELALAAQATELRRSNAELEQFAYIASHDLQEPLRMVASYTELLGARYAGRLDERADKYIGYAVDGARRMQQLVNDLLGYSRVGSQGRPPQPTDSAQVLERVLRSLQATISESKAKITIGALPTLPADATQLGQLFQNLIANAIKFRAERPPELRVSAAPHAEGWLFSVADNGIGIDPQYAERVFQIFQRLHGREAYPGSGIGLAIARRIVERHGGRIWFEPTPGGGTTFYFTMPSGRD